MFMFKMNDLKHSLNLRQQYTPISNNFTIVKEFHVIYNNVMHLYIILFCCMYIIYTCTL
jgi:hypothetical protein